MKKRGLLVASLLILSSFSTLVSCGGTPTSSGSTTSEGTTSEGTDSTTSSEEATTPVKTAYGLVNLTGYYDIEATTLNGYTLPSSISSANSSLLYVDVEEFFNALDGYYNMATRSESPSEYVSFSKNKTGITVTYNYYQYSFSAVFDSKNDTITYDTYFLYNTIEQSGVSYGSHYSSDDSKARSNYSSIANYPPVSVSTADYGADIVTVIDGRTTKTYIPFWLANFLFCSQNYVNLYFNGTEFVATYMDWGSSLTDEEIETYITGSTLGQSGGQSEEEREDVMNQIYFIYDYFYGLKGIPNADGSSDTLYTSAKTYFTENSPEGVANLLSTDPYKNSKGYTQLFTTLLDEGHTYQMTDAMFTTTAYQLSFADLGPRQTALYRAVYGLRSAYAASGLGETKYVSTTTYDEDEDYYSYDSSTETYTLVEEPLEADVTSGTYYVVDDSVVKYSTDGKTAFVKFNSFTTGKDVNIYEVDENGDFVLDESGNKIVSDTAYLYDTYWFFRKAFDEIEAKDGVENVVFDVTQNGGGSVAAEITAAGFLMDDVKYARVEQLVGAKSETVYNVSTGRVDADNESRNGRSYADKYTFYVETSPYTYSAANEFAVMAKQYGWKTIGMQAGGGACSIMPYCLSDGTSIYTSSMSTICTFDAGFNPTFYEYGAKADIEIALDAEGSYAGFYDLDAIAATIEAL